MDNLRLKEEEIASMIRPRGEVRSRIASFFDSRCVFVTGASGFVGKILIEKLLRACGNLDKIYVLIRTKRNKSPGDRLKELLQSVVYDGVREEKLLAKVVAIEGDIALPMLGIGSQDLQVLTRSVSVVFHSAAVVGFEQPLKRAIESNLTGMYNVIQFALKLTELKSFVYVSSAYANCNRAHRLDEHIYPTNVDPETLVEMAASFDEATLELIKQRLVGTHPNTYTYTKSLAEWLCGVYADRLPIVICRPSVITCAWREPIPGYLDNVNAFNGLLTWISSGVLRSAMGNESHVIDIVPVDTVVNCIIANAWFAHPYHSFMRGTIRFDEKGHSASLTEKLARFQGRLSRMVLQKGVDERVAGQLPVFHCSSGVERPIRLAKLADLVIKHANEYPTLQLFRLPNFRWTRSAYLNKWHSLVGQRAVACLLDMLNRHFGDGKSNWAIKSRRAESLARVISYFTLRQWKFNPENRVMLIEEFMSDEDKRLFSCDIKPIDWNKYARNFWLGIRRFMLRAPMEELPEARRYMRVVYWRNTLIQVIPLLFLGLLIYFISL